MFITIFFTLLNINTLYAANTICSADKKDPHYLKVSAADQIGSKFKIEICSHGTNECSSIGGDVIYSSQDLLAFVDDLYAKTHFKIWSSSAVGILAGELMVFAVPALVVLQYITYYSGMNIHNANYATTLKQSLIAKGDGKNCSILYNFYGNYEDFKIEVLARELAIDLYKMKMSSVLE